MASPTPVNPVQNIELNMSRIDFASSVFQGMPTDTWNSRLGWDPSAWIAEALEIRRDWLAKMAAMGVNITISNTPIHPRSAGSNPGSNPLADLIERAFTTFEAEGVGGVNGWKGQPTNPGDPVGDLRKGLAKAVGEADARLNPPPAQPVAPAPIGTAPSPEEYKKMFPNTQVKF